MIIHDPTAAGPQHPVDPTPPRRPRSIRRTSTIDTNRPEGILGPPIVEARARDLWTDADGSALLLGEAAITARLSGPDHVLVDLRTQPHLPALRALLGSVVGPGFRARVDRLVPELRGTGDLLYLLLDDLPGATLVSGYSMLHADVAPRVRHDEYLEARADLCAGWARDGSMMTLIRQHGRSPTPLGPDAPPHTRVDDPDAWHAMPLLGPLGMRRMRRIDVMAAGQPDGRAPVDVFFRDTHVDSAGRETIVHEYSVTVTVETRERRIATIEATADVLPWRECPAAIDSARRLVGHSLADLRPWVRETFIGTSTCTHLNDVLRGLADVGPLLDELARRSTPPEPDEPASFLPTG
jgi:hypothetical protein